MTVLKQKRRAKIKKRIRGLIHGNSEFPRLTVFRSNKEIYASLIDDVNGVTLCAACSLEKEISNKQGTKIEKASLVGGYLYHGRVKSLADGVRTGGLNF